jgi:hypothetical protein
MRSSQVSCCTQILLVALHGRMSDNGLVVVDRDDMARLLGRSSRTITERLREAVDAGYLTRELRGQKGQHARYRAALPTVSEQFSGNPVVPAERAVQGTRELPAERAVSGNPVVPAYLQDKQAYAFTERSEPLAAPRASLTGPIFASTPTPPAADRPQPASRAGAAQPGPYSTPRGQDHEPKIAADDDDRPNLWTDPDWLRQAYPEWGTGS